MEKHVNGWERVKMIHSCKMTDKMYYLLTVSPACLLLPIVKSVEMLICRH